MGTHSYEVWDGCRKIGNFRKVGAAYRCARRQGRLYRYGRRPFWSTVRPWEMAEILRQRTP